MTRIRTSVIALGALSALWLAPAVHAGPNGGGQVVIADLDGDGDDDILLRNPSNDELAYWLIQDGAIVAGGGLGGISDSWEFRGAGKINGDDIDDLVIYDTATSDVFIWFMAFNAGAVTVGSSATVGNSGGFVVKGVGQFNGDSVPDLLLQHSDSTIATWYLDSNGAFAGGGAFGTPGAGWDAIAAMDVNNDGNSDLLLRNTGIGQIGFWETSSGALGVNRGSGFNLDASFKVLKSTDDFDNDGIDDIVLQDAGGTVYVWLMFSDDVTPPTIDSPVTTGAAGATNSVATAGRFNTDDFADVLLVEDAAPNINIATWFLNGGNFVGGGFIGAPPNSYSVTNIGTN